MKRGLISLFIMLVVVVAGTLFWLRGNLDGLVKDAVVQYGGEMTKASVRVDAVEIKAADGQGVIRGLVIGNPPGFKTPHALKVGKIDIVIDVASIARNVVIIKKIAVIAPDVIYEKGDAMTNFDAIQKNIADYLGPAEKKEGGKKLIVAEFTVRDARAEASAAFMGGKTVAVSLPDIILRDIGKTRGGVTPGELGQEIAKAVKQKLSAAVSFDNLMKSTGKSLEKAGSAIKGLFK
ncbi:MAG TPA: hypothetical protein VMV75_03130 [Sulfuricella sp.]|nr:hypothetical protein [Sulfuricella sp.]